MGYDWREARNRAAALIHKGKPGPPRGAGPERKARTEAQSANANPSVAREGTVLLGDREESSSRSSGLFSAIGSGLRAVTPRRMIADTREAAQSARDAAQAAPGKARSLKESHAAWARRFAERGESRVKELQEESEGDRDFLKKTLAPAAPTLEQARKASKGISREAIRSAAIPYALAGLISWVISPMLFVALYDRLRTTLGDPEGMPRSGEPEASWGFFSGPLLWASDLIAMSWTQDPRVVALPLILLSLLGSLVHVSLRWWSKGTTAALVFSLILYAPYVGNQLWPYFPYAQWMILMVISAIAWKFRPDRSAHPYWYVLFLIPESVIVFGFLLSLGGW